MVPYGKYFHRVGSRPNHREGRMHWAARVVIEEKLELMAVAAYLADPNLRETNGVEFFSGEILEIVTAPPEKRAMLLWKFLQRYGVERVADEKPLLAILRTLKEKRDRRVALKEIADVLNSLTAGDVSRKQLMDLRDRLFGMP